MANILLGVTGSVASIYTPQLYRELVAEGHAVKVLATRSAGYFFDLAEIDPKSPGERNAHTCIVDADEWPGHAYQRGDAVLHIELRRWADLLLVAPLDANTLAKFANGLADNLLTCVYRAWDLTRPVILAPAMNTLMWEKCATARHLRRISKDFGLNDLSPSTNPADVVQQVQSRKGRLRLIPPIVKRLACEDVGPGAMAERPTIVAEVLAALAHPNNIKIE